MTERENVLKVYRHEKPEWIPIWNEAFHVAGWASNERGVLGEEIRPGVKLDCFGAEWIAAEGSTVPVTGHYVLEDITDWREVVKFPHPREYNWDMIRAMELDGYDGTKCLVYFCEEGLFDRLTTLMGFEEGMIALVTEPEECAAFFQRLTEYKIELIECAKKYIKPDVVMYTDDIAKSDSLFISPDCYREVIKPYHAQIIQAIKENGMIAEQHTCRRTEHKRDQSKQHNLQRINIQECLCACGSSHRGTQHDNHDVHQCI